MNSSESGRKLNQAVNTTSKAVGGALSQAKGAFSNFWSAFTAPTVAAVPTTPTTNQPTNDLIDDDITSSVADEVKANEIDEKNRNRCGEHCGIDPLKMDIERNKDTGINDKHRNVEIAREADPFDSIEQNERGQVFDI